MSINAKMNFSSLNNKICLQINKNCPNGRQNNQNISSTELKNRFSNISSPEFVNLVISYKKRFQITILI